MEDVRDRFEKLGLQYERSGPRRNRDSLSMQKTINANSQFVDRCEILQNGETVSIGQGHQSCEEALEDFEDLLSDLD